MANQGIDLKAALKQAPITSTLGDAALEDLARSSVVRQFRRGQVLFSEGDQGESFYLVLSGRVRVLRYSDEGNELVLSVVGPGGAIGELSIFDTEPRSATVEAIERCVMLAVPNARIREALMASPASLLAVVSGLAATVRRLTGSASDLVFLDVPHRIVKFLLLNCIDHGDGTAHVDLPMSQSGTAAQLGIARQTFNTALRSLARENLIVVEGRKIGIPNLAALRAFLDE